MNLIERLRAEHVRNGGQGAYAWKSRELCGKAATEIERLTAQVKRMREALEPFVEGYAHTSVFLRSREKMHPAGQDLYREDVERARAALAYRGGD